MEKVIKVPIDSKRRKGQETKYSPGELKLFKDLSGQLNWLDHVDITTAACPSSNLHQFTCDLIGRHLSEASRAPHEIRHSLRTSRITYGVTSNRGVKDKHAA